MWARLLLLAPTKRSQRFLLFFLLRCCSRCSTTCCCTSLSWTKSNGRRFESVSWTIWLLNPSGRLLLSRFVASLCLLNLLSCRVTNLIFLCLTNDLHLVLLLLLSFILGWLVPRLSLLLLLLLGFKFFHFYIGAFTLKLLLLLLLSLRFEVTINLVLFCVRWIRWATLSQIALNCFLVIVIVGGGAWITLLRLLGEGCLVSCSIPGKSPYIRRLLDFD